MTALSRARANRVALSAMAIGLVICGAAPLAAQSTPPVRPLSLAEALTIARGASENVELAKAGAQRARGQQLSARSAMLPQVGTTLSWQKQLQNQFSALTNRSSGSGSGTGGGSDTASTAENPITRIFASQYNFNFGLNASQPLFTGGRVAAGLRSA